jgi:hypothetical protein
MTGEEDLAVQQWETAKKLGSTSVKLDEKIESRKYVETK